MRALIGVELLRKLPAGPCDIRDSKLPGFVLRVRDSGAHTYFANYGRGKWQRLGTTSVLTAPEAREQARQVLGDVMKGGDPVAAKRAQESRMTFDAFITDHYEPWALANLKGGKEQTAQLRRLGFGALRLDEISAFHVERWRSAQLKKVKKETVNRILSILRGALTQAVRWNKVTVHPFGVGKFSTVKASKTDRFGRVVRYLKDGEETRLRAALTKRDDTRRAERERANLWRRERGYAEWPTFGLYTDHLTPMVLMALGTGLRRGELFHLRWQDIDIAAARVTVQGDGAKSGQTRHVPLNTDIAKVLRAWQPADVPADARVFPGADGQPLEDIKTAWGPVLKAAKVSGFRFHDCRHDFASKLVMAGVDLNTVRELLGHADIKMTLRYAHLAPEHMAAAVAKLVRA